MSNDVKTTIASAVSAACILIPFLMPKVGTIPQNVQDAITTLCYIGLTVSVVIWGKLTNKPEAPGVK